MAEALETPGAADDRVKVWDPVVRIFHWTLVLAFFGAFLTDSPRSVHETFGFVAIGAVAVRLVWGFVGTRHARFADFVPRPSTFFGYVRDTALGTGGRYLGHNPAGGAMVVTLITMVALLGVTGWMMTLDAFWGADWLEALHAAVANTAVFLVAMHVAGVVWESWRHGENLVAAMITGKKRR
jgi:cytochrome b